MTRLLHSYLANFKLAPQFTEAEVEHYLLPVEDVICTHVVESHSESFNNYDVRHVLFKAGPQHTKRRASEFRSCCCHQGFCTGTASGA